MNLQKIFFLFLLFFCLAALVIAAIKTSPFQQFSFSEEDELKDWEEKILNGKVSYWIESEGFQTFLHAKSQTACSAIYRRVKFNPNECPIISWKWDIAEFPKKDQNTVEVDDFPARLYLIFPGISFGTSKFLEYTWDEFIEKEKILDGPSPNIKVIVVESGRKSQQGGRGWVSQKRNIVKDYIKAFKKRPTKKVGAIALMCDADTTKSSAESYFDEIVIDYKK